MTTALGLLLALLAMSLGLAVVFVLSVLLVAIRFILPAGEQGQWDISESGLLRNQQGHTVRMLKPALLIPWVVVVRVSEHQAEPEHAARAWLWFWRDSLDTQGWSRLRRTALNVNHAR